MKSIFKNWLRNTTKVDKMLTHKYQVQYFHDHEGKAFLHFTKVLPCENFCTAILFQRLPLDYIGSSLHNANFLIFDPVPLLGNNLSKNKHDPPVLGSFPFQMIPNTRILAHF